MKWSDIIDLIAAEVGSDVAERIEESIRRRFGGEHCRIKKRPTITSEKIHATAPGKPKLAARKLGIHPTTAYRAIHRAKIIR